jgi:hypothetical protein
MTMQLIEKNGKKVLEMIFEGKTFRTVDHATVYGLKDKPYIKRLGEKMYLSPETLTGEVVKL